MKFRVKSIPWNKATTDAVVLFISEDNWLNELKEVDRILEHNLSTFLNATHFKAIPTALSVYPVPSKALTKYLILVGIGKSESVTADSFRRAAAVATKSAQAHKADSIAFDLSQSGIKISSQELAQVVVEGAALGGYRFTTYKNQPANEPRLEEIILLATPSRLQYSVNGVREGEMYAAATLFARDLVNESPTITTPTYLAQVAKSLGKKNEISVEILDNKQIKKLGMGAFLAVSLGSAESPKFIKLTYRGGKKKIVIAGKAVTFDTGGLQIKDGYNMQTMKLDMAGAAAVLGLFSVIKELAPKATVIGLIAATENMPGPAAMKPGDILRSLSGKTIEIGHTDAEGRLTLADVLSFAQTENPDFMLDLATLTGACMIALGEQIAGLFANNPDLLERLKKAAKDSGEKVWQLPLEEDYKDLNKSSLADIRNIPNTRYGGAITAALFLEEFVGNTPWAHLDIAGPAYAEKDTLLARQGATGYGVRLLINFLKNL